MDIDAIKYEIEQLIDAEGPRTVLEAFAGVCQEKAEHVAENYEDRDLGRSWYNAGVSILRFLETKRATQLNRLGDLWDR